MDKQHGAAIAIQERMTVSEQAHDQAGPVGHLAALLRACQAVLDRPTAVARVAKVHVTLGDGFIGDKFDAVGTRPG